MKKLHQPDFFSQPEEDILLTHAIYLQFHAISFKICQQFLFYKMYSQESSILECF